MTQIPYEKGALFLRTLERKLGRAKFDEFLRSYFDEHAFQSIVTADFVDFLAIGCSRPNPQVAQAIDLDAWIEQPGLPEAFAEPKSDRLEAIDQAARVLARGYDGRRKLGAGQWSTQEWLHFLQALPEKLSPAKMAELDQPLA